jgi:hypothetical protein
MSILARIGQLQPWGSCSTSTEWDPASVSSRGRRSERTLGDVVCRRLASFGRICLGAAKKGRRAGGQRNAFASNGIKFIACEQGFSPMMRLRITRTNRCCFRVNISRLGQSRRAPFPGLSHSVECHCHYEPAQQRRYTGFSIGTVSCFY